MKVIMPLLGLQPYAIWPPTRTACSKTKYRFNSFPSQRVVVFDSLPPSSSNGIVLSPPRTVCAQSRDALPSLFDGSLDTAETTSTHDENDDDGHAQNMINSLDDDIGEDEEEARRRRNREQRRQEDNRRHEEAVEASLSAVALATSSSNSSKASSATVSSNFEGNSVIVENNNGGSIHMISGAPAVLKLRGEHEQSDHTGQDTAMQCLQNLMAMGFEESECRSALKQAEQDFETVRLD